MATKVASGVGAGLLSEGAGQATEGEAIEPYARLGGALLGGGAGSMVGSGKAVKGVLDSAPTQQAVKAAADDAYSTLRKAGIQYDDNAYQSFAMKLVSKLRDAGWRPRNDDSVTRDMHEIMQRVGKPNDFAELENLRGNVGSFSPFMKSREKAHAAIMRESLDEFTSSGNMISKAGLPQEQVNALAAQARDMARRNILARDMDALLADADWYPSGIESGTRNKVATYGKRNEKRLTKEEAKALKKVVRREGLLNIANTAGSRMGLAMGIPGAAASGAALGGPIGAVGGVGLSLLGQLGSRKVMENVTARAMDKAKKTMLLGRHGQKKLAKARKLPRVQAVQRTGLLGASAYPVQDSGRR
jgi:hypothetical protein